MKNIAKLLSLAIFALSLAHSQTATVTRNANLRSNPSTNNDPIVLLKRSASLTLVEADPSNGFYHVKTSQDQEGWVWAKNVKIVQKETGGGQSSVGGSETAATAISPDWEKPDPQDSVYQGSEGSCGETGKGGDDITNARKNRIDIPSSYHLVTWEAINSTLETPQTAPRSRVDWSDPSLAETLKPYEGAAVSVIGYLNTIKVENSSPSAKSGGESTNCHFHAPDNVDWHMPLTANSGEGENVAIVVETTPRIRQQHPNWTTTDLKPWTYQIHKKDNPDYGNQPVRISGWLMFDPEHWNMVHSGLRSTLWEVHPITKIEVFQNGHWVDLDNLH